MNSQSIAVAGGQTKLGALCERIMEAGWLLALIVEPLFFNVYSDRVFEPDKLAILRSIALVLVGTWVVRLVEMGSRAGSGEGKPSLGQYIRETPLVLFTLLLAAIYVLSTITSIVPRLSLWGSYQRLQGTYSTLSYLVIFATIITTLRRREQLERLILVAILVSFPIALYGLMQHFELDPLPWGGNVTTRVASNMGNSIFVAAYLIMIVPLTLRNLLENLAKVLEDEVAGVKGAFIAGYILALIIQFVAWGKIGYVAGILVGAMFTLLMALFSLSMHKPAVNFCWIGVYSVALVAQLICILYTQSRGPWIGLAAGIFFFMLVFAFVRRIRWLQWGSITLSLLVIAFLAVLNFSGTLFDPIKQIPYVGRLGRIFEMDKGTGKVRTLIWEGVIGLLSPHEPIGLPGKEDSLNVIRPLIGYGPESMIVAYNPFYPPDLAHYERRNASPDRSHNETFDALVTTGFIGLVVYFGLFISLFYHSLKWLGLIEHNGHRNIFLGLGIGAALLGAIIPALVEGTFRLAGVGLPFGLVIGVGLYLVISSVIVRHDANQPADSRQLLLMALLSAIVAHFVEIHFGIAIAATRTYFWTYAAVLVVVGMAWIAFDGNGKEAQAQSDIEVSRPDRADRRKSSRSRRRAAERETRAPAPTKWAWAGVIAYVLLVGVIFMTLGYDFVTNQQGVRQAWDVLTNSLTVLSRGNEDRQSYAMLWLFLFTWFMGAVLSLTQTPRSDDSEAEPGLIPHLITLGVYVVGTLAIFLLFTLPHAGRLQPGTDVALALKPYYWAIFAALAAVGVALAREVAMPAALVRPSARWTQPFLIPGVTALAIFLVSTLNLSMVKGDIYYKQGKHFDQSSVWDGAIQLYRRSINLAKDQDFYYLFLGRAFLEKASSLDDPTQRALLLDEARQSLEEARRLNPLNTDHSANLARLYRTEGEMLSDPALREQALRKALGYYRDATRLSPNTAKLHNEWGLVYTMLGEGEKALAEFEISLSLDQQYDETYLFLGNYYLNQQQYEEAADAYRKAIEIEPKRVQAHSALGYVYSKMGLLEDAIEENLAVLEISPNDYSSLKNLAILYQQLGRIEEAIAAATAALEKAPDNEEQAVQAFIRQLEELKSYGDDS